MISIYFNFSSASNVYCWMYIINIIRNFAFRMTSIRCIFLSVNDVPILLTIKVHFRNAEWHDDVIKWKHVPRYWPFVRGIHRSPVNSPHKGQWHRALMFSLICVWINAWVNNREAGDLRRFRVHYDVSVMVSWFDKWKGESRRGENLIIVA